MNKLIAKIGAALLVLSVLLLALFLASISRDLQRIRQADYKAVLSASRELILTRTNYSANKFVLPYYPKSTNWFCLMEKDLIGNRALEPIRELQPKNVIIHEDLVQIYLHSPRVTLLAFAEGVDQYGTYKLIDGLWFWDGKLSNEVDTVSLEKRFKK